MKSIFKHFFIFIVAPLFLPAVPVFAAEETDKEIQQLRMSLLNTLPQAAGATINATPIEGVFQVIAGPQIIYISKDGRYIIDGDLFDLQTRNNLSENARVGLRVKAVKELGEANMLVYKPEGEIKHTITIFTDIYCPYCRKLHQELPDYMKNNVKVRYIFLPFKGAKSFDVSVSVWCADDQNKAMDMAKSGQEIEQKKCSNPIALHKDLGMAIGVRGTPAIMFEDGNMSPGYVPASKVIQQLNNADKAVADKSEKLKS